MERATDSVGRVSGFVTSVDDEDVVVRYADPEHRADQVSVWAHLRLGDTTMARVAGGWEVRLSDLPVDRLEYLLDVDGSLRPDPGNPQTVAGPFGDHSWIALPAYREPEWLAAEPIESERIPVTVSRSAVGRLDAEVWSPADAAPHGAPAAAGEPRRPRDGRLRRADDVRRRTRRRRSTAADAGGSRRCGPAQPAVRRQPGVRAGARDAG